jgi:hypothetical protein
VWQFQEIPHGFFSARKTTKPTDLTYIIREIYAKISPLKKLAVKKQDLFSIDPLR